MEDEVDIRPLTLGRARILGWDLQSDGAALAKSRVAAKVGGMRKDNNYPLATWARHRQDDIQRTRMI